MCSSWSVVEHGSHNRSSSPSRRLVWRFFLEMRRFLHKSALMEGHFFVTDREPKVANDGSTESFDQEVSNDVVAPFWRFVLENSAGGRERR